MPASRSFPTGSNILLAMFNSYFTWGIETTKWFQLLRHYISVCPLLLPLSSSHTPSGTFLPFRVKGQLFSKPKPAGPVQKRNLRRCGEWHVRACTRTPTPHTHTPFHMYHSTYALVMPPHLQHNYPSFTGSASFSLCKMLWKEGCVCNFWLEAVYLWPWNGYCVHGVTTGVLFQLHCVLTTKPPVKLNKITNFTVDFLPALLCSPHTPGLSPHTAGDSVGPNQ